MVFKRVQAAVPCPRPHTWTSPIHAHIQTHTCKHTCTHTSTPLCHFTNSLIPQSHPSTHQTRHPRHNSLWHSLSTPQNVSGSDKQGHKIKLTYCWYHGYVITNGLNKNKQTDILDAVTISQIPANNKLKITGSKTSDIHNGEVGVLALLANIYYTAEIIHRPDIYIYLSSIPSSPSLLYCRNYPQAWYVYLFIFYSGFSFHSLNPSSSTFGHKHILVLFLS